MYAKLPGSASDVNAVMPAATLVPRMPWALDQSSVEHVFMLMGCPSLPVLQVRNFGRRGRTKWTHLLAEDTSAQAVEGPRRDPVNLHMQEFGKPKNMKT